MATLLDAIYQRESRREYIYFPIETDKVAALETLVNQYNDENPDINIRLVTNDDILFSSFFSSYGLHSGIRNYFTLVTKKYNLHGMNQLGYYGEMLVLHATNLGLGTCWISGTYDKEKAKLRISMKPDEELIGIIAVGYTKESKTIREQITKTFTKRSTKDIKEMYLSNEIVPEAFIDGMRAVQRAPSAMNKQPVMFRYKDHVVTARVESVANHNALDLGIAMCHFLIGSRTTNEWTYKEQEREYQLIL